MAAELTWKRSSYSDGEEQNCVECAVDDRSVWIRDSKDRTGRLRVSIAGWTAFLVLARS